MRSTIANAAYFGTVTLLLLTYIGLVSSVISTDLSFSQLHVDEEGRYQNLVISINLKMSEFDMEEETEYLHDVKVLLTPVYHRLPLKLK